MQHHWETNAQYWAQYIVNTNLVRENFQQIKFMLKLSMLYQEKIIICDLRLMALNSALITAQETLFDRNAFL